MVRFTIKNTILFLQRNIFKNQLSIYLNLLKLYQ